MDKLYVVMPAYNEEANIEAVVRSWYPILERKSEGSRLIVADSGSSDSQYHDGDIFFLLQRKNHIPRDHVPT